MQAQRGRVHVSSASIRWSGTLRDEEVLPDGEAEFARAVFLRQIGQAEHLLGREPTHGNHHADVVEAGLLLLEDSDMPVADDGVARFTRRERQAAQGKGEFLFPFPPRTSPPPSGR